MKQRHDGAVVLLVLVAAVSCAGCRKSSSADGEPVASPRAPGVSSAEVFPEPEPSGAAADAAAPISSTAGDTGSVDGPAADRAALEATVAKVVAAFETRGKAAEALATQAAGMTEVTELFAEGGAGSDQPETDPFVQRAQAAARGVRTALNAGTASGRSPRADVVWFVEAEGGRGIATDEPFVPTHVMRYYQYPIDRMFVGLDAEKVARILQRIRAGTPWRDVWLHRDEIGDFLTGPLDVALAPIRKPDGSTAAVVMVGSRLEPLDDVARAAGAHVVVVRAGEGEGARPRVVAVGRPGTFPEGGVPNLCIDAMLDAVSTGVRAGLSGAAGVETGTFGCTLDLDRSEREFPFAVAVAPLPAGVAPDERSWAVGNLAVVVATLAAPLPPPEPMDEAAREAEVRLNLSKLATLLEFATSGRFPAAPPCVGVPPLNEYSVPRDPSLVVGATHRPSLSDWTGPWAEIRFALSDALGAVYCYESVDDGAGFAVYGASDADGDGRWSVISREGRRIDGEAMIGPFVVSERGP